MHLLPYISVSFGIIILLLMLYFSIVSYKEEEPLAFRRGLTLMFLLPAPYLLAGLINFEYQTSVCLVLVGSTILASIAVLIPTGNNIISPDEIPKTKIDERDIMFSRRLLKEGSERFNEYYKKHPELKSLDDEFRSHPGLLQNRSVHYDPVMFGAARASFTTVNAFHAILDEENLPASPQSVAPDHISKFIKQWLKKIGAVSVGITELRDYHLYSIIGRGEKFGEPVALDHKYAIALTVEMDKFWLDRAPKGPAVMESAQQYLKSGALAVQLAELIRQLGYSARAHIDGNYRVVCPLVARDAGLGEIGRMGLLMTPELGPRVRISVVTTDLKLVPNARRRDETVIDFCRQCKKCADVCPSQAIPFEDRKDIDGILRWQIDSEACYTLWCKIGTDCGRCMSVCPYSHPNTVLHNLVRADIKRSVLFRKLALKMDDLFYGRKPAPLEIPDWISDIKESSKNQT